MRCCHAALAAAAAAALTTAAVPQQTGSCIRRGGSAACGEDHVLLQRGGAQLSLGEDAGAPQDVANEYGCHGMPDVKRSCASNGCLVLADDMVGLSCDAFCERSGRRCLSAWEEVDNDCNQKLPLGCDQSYGSTSDLLCMCGPGVYGLAGMSAQQLVGELIWSDEFDGGAVDTSRWELVDKGGGFGNQELQYYTARRGSGANAFLRDGNLHIEARCENYGSERFTSAKLLTATSWGPGHRIEVRAKLPAGRGSWPAIWMLPKDNAYGKWPYSGEIDIVEAVGCSQGKIYGTVHTGAYNHMKNTQAYNSLPIDPTDWHTYAIQWTERGLQWYVDGGLYSTFAPTHQNSERWPFDQQFYLILNVAVGGSWGGSCLNGGSPSCGSGSDFGGGQVMEVDYARVYRI